MQTENSNGKMLTVERNKVDYSASDSKKRCSKAQPCINV